MIRFDPRAKLRQWAIDVDIGGRTYTIPALAARVWLLAVVDGWPTSVLPGLLPADAADPLDDQIIDGRVNSAECETVARDALAAAAGTVTWWVAARLAHACVASSLGAELTLRGVAPDRLPLAAYLDAAYHLGRGYLSGPAERGRWDFELERPPPGEEMPYDDDEAARMFLTSMAAATSGAATG